MDPNKLFTPKTLKDQEGMESFSALSGNYFKVAQELREKSKNNDAGMPGHYYVFPSVIMYVSSLEAFFSEYLALVLFSNKDDERVINLKAQNAPYNDFKSWLNEIFKIFNKSGMEIDYGGELFQNVYALKELRNSAAHYNPYFINHIDWPKRLQQVLNKSKIEVINSGWVCNLTTPVVSDWAYETIKGVIVTFSEVSGWENPFTQGFPNGWESHQP